MHWDGEGRWQNNSLVKGDGKTMHWDGEGRWQNNALVKGDGGAEQNNTNDALVSYKALSIGGTEQTMYW